MSFTRTNKQAWSVRLQAHPNWRHHTLTSQLTSHSKHSNLIYFLDIHPINPPITCISQTRNAFGGLGKFKSANTPNSRVLSQFNDRLPSWSLHSIPTGMQNSVPAVLNNLLLYPQYYHKLLHYVFFSVKK